MPAVPVDSVAKLTGEPTQRFEQNSSLDSGEDRPDDGDVIEAFTEPYRDIAVSASEMGTVLRINVKEGDVVQAGDEIAGLDDLVLVATLEVARAGKNATGQMKSAEAELRMRQTERQKLLELRERNHATQREVDRVDTELEMAEARLIAAKEDAEIKSLEYKRIEAQLDQKKIRSPIDGVVTEIRKDAGEFVSPTDPVIARVVQLDPLLIVFSVPLEFRNQIQPDQLVSLLVEGSNSTTGTVEYVSKTADESNTSIRVKVRLPNPNGEWQAGQRTVLDLEAKTTNTNQLPSLAKNEK
ncbi:MAG: efflux RND transporter periplasmic adaptor subunit [Planctomycetaceae bacterium]|nr:efflux RND transporter periplasmic adaptor subunit [Planctomycetaceae bacterium]